MRVLYKTAPEVPERLLTLSTHQRAARGGGDLSARDMSEFRRDFHARFVQLDADGSDLDDFIEWTATFDLLDSDLQLGQLVPPRLCEICVDQIRATSDFPFAVRVLTFLQILLRADAAHFRAGLRSLGLVEVVSGLLSESRAFAEVSLTIIGLFLVADDEPSRALVRKHFEIAIDAARLFEADSALRRRLILSSLFFFECAFSCAFVGDSEVTEIAKCLVDILTQEWPSPFIFRICYCLCKLTDAFPDRIMFVGQSAIVMLLGRYLFRGGDFPVDDDELFAVICVFQALFFWPGPHFSYLYPDESLFRQFIALTGDPGENIRRAAIRTLTLAISRGPEIIEGLVTHGFPKQLNRLIECEPPFSIVQEVGACVICLLNGADCETFLKLMQSPIVAYLLFNCREFWERHLIPLAEAVQAGIQKCGQDAAIEALQVILTETGLIEPIAWLGDELLEAQTDLTALREFLEMCE
jgi:hypothetical protein